MARSNLLILIVALAHINITQQQCLENSCQNNGLCNPDPNGGKSCTCPPGTDGPKCSFPVHQLENSDQTTSNPLPEHPPEHICLPPQTLEDNGSPKLMLGDKEFQSTKPITQEKLVPNSVHYKRSIDFYYDSICKGALVFSDTHSTSAEGEIPRSLVHLSGTESQGSSLQGLSASTQPIPIPSTVLIYEGSLIHRGVQIQHQHGGQATSMFYAPAKETIRSWYRAFMSLLTKYDTYQIKRVNIDGVTWNQCSGGEILILWDGRKKIMDHNEEVKLEHEISMCGIWRALVLKEKFKFIDDATTGGGTSVGYYCFQDVSTKPTLMYVFQSPWIEDSIPSPNAGGSFSEFRYTGEGSESHLGFDCRSCSIAEMLKDHVAAGCSWGSISKVFKSEEYSELASNVQQSVCQQFKNCKYISLCEIIGCPNGMKHPGASTTGVQASLKIQDFFKQLIYPNCNCQSPLPHYSTHTPIVEHYDNFVGHGCNKMMSKMISQKPVFTPPFHIVKSSPRGKRSTTLCLLFCEIKDNALIGWKKLVEKSTAIFNKNFQVQQKFNTQSSTYMTKVSGDVSKLSLGYNSLKAAVESDEQAATTNWDFQDRINKATAHDLESLVHSRVWRDTGNELLKEQIQSGLDHLKELYPNATYIRTEDFCFQLVLTPLLVQSHSHFSRIDGSKKVQDVSISKSLGITPPQFQTAEPSFVHSLEFSYLDVLFLVMTTIVIIAGIVWIGKKIKEKKLLDKFMKPKSNNDEGSDNPSFSVSDETTTPKSSHKEPSSLTLTLKKLQRQRETSPL